MKSLFQYISILFIITACTPSAKTEQSSRQKDDFICQEFWNGALTLGPNKLNICFTLKTKSDSTLHCTMDVPQQGAKDLPVKIILNSADSLCLSMPMLQATYHGCKKSESLIEGTFTQRGASFDLNLSLDKSKLKINRPQTPQEPYPYTTQEVEFVNENDGAILSGTLIYPIGRKAGDVKDIPLVIMVTGSGQQDRNEQIFDHKPFLVLADHLAKHGIATLRYDDRGVGKSRGSLTNATSHTFMTDALAAKNFAANTDNWHSIGVLGHSEGGTIAFMLAAQGQADFIISLAGTAISGLEVIIGQNKAILALKGESTNIIDNYVKALRLLYTDRIASKLIDNEQEYINTLCSANSINLPQNYKDNLQQCITAGGEWFTYFLQYNPITDIQRIQCPVMALNGSNDLQVLAQENLSSLRQHLPSHPKHLIKEYPNLNHMFQHCTPEQSLNYSEIEETISPEVLEDIVKWIRALND